MSTYITMVDMDDDDVLCHGKFIAKVKGLGGKIRYFYNQNEYAAFLRGGKKGYQSQKKTNQMNRLSGLSGQAHARDEQYRQSQLTNTGVNRKIRSEAGRKNAIAVANENARQRAIAGRDAVNAAAEKRASNRAAAKNVIDTAFEINRKAAARQAVIKEGERVKRNAAGRHAAISDMNRVNAAAEGRRVNMEATARSADRAANEQRRQNAIAGRNEVYRQATIREGQAANSAAMERAHNRALAAEKQKHSTSYNTTGAERDARYRAEGNAPSGYSSSAVGRNNAIAAGNAANQTAENRKRNKRRYTIR